MLKDYAQITLVLGVDALHLEELRWVWPCWMKFRPELLQMPVIVFYDPAQVDPEQVTFLREHPNLRWVAWSMPSAETQREAMISGWVHIPAREVQTKWYLKLDTDALATGPADWLQESWFARDAQGREPVFISSHWGYSKPRYVMDVLDDWGDRHPRFSRHPRLNLPYSSASLHISHPRIISWFFIGRTDWTREAASWTGKEGRLPFPSQDTFLFYCAARLGEHFVRTPMIRYGWRHKPFRMLRPLITDLGLAPDDGWNVQMATGTEKARGVIYYNYGTRCAVRLLVSLYSLRQHYRGPVTILSEGEESHRVCRAIAAACGAEVKEWNCEVPEGEHRVYLAKTRYHEGTPYETTVALDSDTLVVGPIDELFGLAESGGFCVSQLGNWQSRGHTISARIRGWASWLPRDIEPALSFGPAINCGVVAFRKDAEIFRDWLRLALPGRANFIPDESCCQVILHRYPHKILGSEWNCSCKHANPADPATRIIHYHGGKHCRIGLPYHGERWFRMWEEVRALNLARVKRWAPAGDRPLRHYLRQAHKAALLAKATAPTL